MTTRFPNVLLIFFGFLFALSSPYSGMRNSPLVFPLCLPDHKRHVFSFNQVKVGFHHFFESVKPLYWVTIGIMKTSQPQILNVTHKISVKHNDMSSTSVHISSYTNKTIYTAIYHIKITRLNIILIAPQSTINWSST